MPAIERLLMDAQDEVEGHAHEDRMARDLQAWDEEEEAHDVGLEFPLTEAGAGIDLSTFEHDAAMRNLGHNRDFLLPGRISPRSGALSG